MPNSALEFKCAGTVPTRLSRAVQNYLLHTTAGVSIRALARDAGCHASTIHRQIQKTEARRDDPIFDAALTWLGSLIRQTSLPDNFETKDKPTMNAQISPTPATSEQTGTDRETKRILRRLCEPGACLAVAAKMEKAVVVRETDDGRTIRTAVTDRPTVQAMVLNDWITGKAAGRVTRYHVTAAGRAALREMLLQDHGPQGFAEMSAGFDGPKTRVAPISDEQDDDRLRRIRYNMAESPIAAMARRKDKSGKPFLSSDLVGAAERLREDFELAQMETQQPQTWDECLSGDGSLDNSGAAKGPARTRVAEALRDLGPGLGDVALRVCCYMDGVETAEKRMGWSARSGKIVLRIALQRLKRHYDARGGSALIG